ncbi:TetR/AcrR family transcriptional regulator [Tenuibacillus multivorans]|uniref:TetR/AcrR family transcriptional regulator, fatty acid metabolism regulator protein n=1 Tax=Tenuibacillus multivorans TaxID=237069 RepID=A0A1G9ZQ84_9BACI|nr:TetR/AcrR family transcriptional regulator [Tenuibacillus multivorans]GEL76810.1 fatty acid metabolism regulator protein [Tenuibacillus multivorans]SDN23468.1 TetR/AcrR family transcriptional regulator, fatty acid metabolism regulator protein [Tenuibacillus multivorans]
MKNQKPKYRQIIDAAVEVIAENGYYNSQVSKIAKRAGVADGTIYLYFENKEDILISVFQEKMGQFIERIENVIVDQESADDKLSALIKMHFRQLAEDPDLAIVTQLELRQSKKMLRLKINEVLKRYLTVVDNILKDGMDQGIFHDHLNVKLVRQMIFGTLDEVVTNWVMKEQKYNLVDQAEEVHFVISNGLKIHHQ